MKILVVSYDLLSSFLSFSCATLTAGRMYLVRFSLHMVLPLSTWNWSSFFPEDLNKCIAPVSGSRLLWVSQCHRNISSENTVAVCTANAALLLVIIKEISLYFFNDKYSLCINLVLHDNTPCQRSPTNMKTYTSRIIRKVIYVRMLMVFCSVLHGITSV